MRNFLHDIIFTFLFCLSLIVIMEIAIGKTQTSHSYKDWYMTEHADKIKILLLGNSLFENSFDPHVFGDSVFDAASNSRRLWYDVQILKKYAPRMSNLRTVIIPINICYPAEPQSIRTFRYPYARYLGISYENNLLQYSALFSGLFTFRDLRQVTICDSVNENMEFERFMDSCGYIPIFHTRNHNMDNPPSATQEVVRTNKKDNTPSHWPMYLDCIAEIAQYCDSHNIQLIYVLPPAADLFLGKNQEATYCSFNSCLDELRGTVKFDYKDYHNDAEFRSNHLYADELHLNHIGASLFAQRVKEDFNL